MKFFKYFSSRVAEPSTWAGLSVLAACAGINPAYLTSLQGVVTAVAGAAAVFIPEKNNMSPELQLIMTGIDILLLPLSCYIFSFIIRVEKKLTRIETKLGIKD